MATSGESSHFHGLELDLRVFSGAHAVRVVHPRKQSIEQHQHDWLSLDIYVLGSYLELHDGAQIRITRPAVVLRPAHEPHMNQIDDTGLEMIGIQLDPAWLSCAGFDQRLERTRHWIGGPVAVAARRLVKVWSRNAASEEEVATETVAFLRGALAATPAPTPTWLDRVLWALDSEKTPTTAKLAQELNLHPAWLARAYRTAVAEGLTETLRRKRVERAAALLRSSNFAAAQIAIETGFCDQSHMIRGFHSVIGRTPMQVRAEQEHLRAFA